MFKYQFYKRLRDCRKKAGLTQEKAGAMVGISRSRWSQIETGYRIPTSGELAKLKTHFFLDNVYIPPAGIYRELRDKGASLLPESKLFLSSQDRDSFFRYWKAVKVYPELTKQLMTIVASRPDFPKVEFIFHNIAFDSYLEVLNFLFLVARGATPVSAAPLQLGQLPSPIREPFSRLEVGQRPHLCLYLSNSLYFFQVSFRVSTPLRVDVLVHDGQWRIVELIGAGHDFYSDNTRAELCLPVTIIHEAELVEKIRNFLNDQMASSRAA